MHWTSFRIPAALAALCLSACTNSPYRAEFEDRKVYYTSYDDAPKTLDPAVAYTTTAHELVGKTYETLLEYHYLKRPFTLIAGIAAELPRSEQLPDGHTRYRFTLRDDLLYQDDPCFAAFGADSTRRIVAQDVAFELMRIADPTVDSPVGEPFSNILGWKDFTARLVAQRARDPSLAKLPAQEQYARAGGIEGVATPSPTEIAIELEHPYPQILYWFAMPFTAPMPWEAVAYYDGNGGRPALADHPVGSGPYRLERYDKESRIVLVKNDRWYGIRHPEWHAPGATYPSEGERGDAAAGLLRPEAVGRPLPFLERIELRREKERIPTFNKFLQGYYDLSGIIRESFERMVQGGSLSPDMVQKGMRLAKSVTPAVYYIGFNMEDRTVGIQDGERSRKLRQAMSLVVDSAEYSRLFMNGRGIPATSPLPPGIFGYSPDYQNPFRTVDQTRAKALLTEAGYPGGVDPSTGRPLHLTFDSGDTSVDGRLRYQFFVQEWRQLGIDVEIAATNYNKFQDKVRQGAYQIFLWGWVADYPDPENFLFLLSSEMARSKQGGPNTANYANPDFDALFAQMKILPDGAERLDLIRRMLELLERDRPWIELYYPESYGLYQGWLKNVKPMGLSIPLEKYYDVVPEERTAFRKSENQPVLWPVYALLALLALIVTPGVRTFLRERQ